MAQIIGLEEQKLALKDIEKKIEEVADINTLLSNIQSGNGAISLSFIVDGRRKSIKLTNLVDNVIPELLLKEKERIIDYVIDLANNHNIKLDQEDYAALGTDFNPNAQEMNVNNSSMDVNATEEG